MEQFTLGKRILVTFFILMFASPAFACTLSDEVKGFSDTESIHNAVVTCLSALYSEE